MQNSILFQNARIVDPSCGRDEVSDLLVENGKIAKIEKDIQAPDAQNVDCTGKVIVPGFVDLHCHLREPGFEYKEDIESGTRAAAHGGFTTVCCMPNLSPVNDNAAVTSYIVNKAAQKGSVKVRPIGAITKGLKGEELAEIGQMKEAGIVAVSDDGKPVMNSRMMYNAIKYAADFGLKVTSHCEDTNLAGNGVMNEGYHSTVLGLRGIPRSAEEVMLAREILLSETLKLPVHICHVSTKGGVQLLREAKARGVQVTAETCPHYIALTDAEVEGYDPNTRVNPPLREREDVQAIIEGLLDGSLDCIATDHAPHHRDEKMVEYEVAASGISGFETAFSVCYTALVATGKMSFEKLIEKMTCAPAKIFDLDCGTLGVGACADLTVLDLEQNWTVDAKAFLSKGKNTPFDGKPLTGKVMATYVDGKCVYGEEAK